MTQLDVTGNRLLAARAREVGAASRVVRIQTAAEVVARALDDTRTVAAARVVVQMACDATYNLRRDSLALLDELTSGEEG